MKATRLLDRIGLGGPKCLIHILLAPLFLAAWQAQGAEFDFGDGRHGSVNLAAGITTIESLWQELRLASDATEYDPANPDQIPNLQDLSLAPGGVLTASAFQGPANQPPAWQNGGVVRLRVAGTLHIQANAAVHASGKGYAGGMGVDAAPGRTGAQGDSWGHAGGFTTAEANGAGGGGQEESSPGLANPGGGGGGAHATAGEASDSLGARGGRGGAAFDTVAAAQGAAFAEDYALPRFGAGGGRGGYAKNGTNDGAFGGRGGGIILIEARKIVNDGEILADGSGAGSALSGGGGGAGGSIQVRALSLRHGIVSATGGQGGTGLDGQNNGGYGGQGIVDWQSQFALTPAVRGSGDLDLEPEGPQYPVNAEVASEARPADGWVFDRWEGALTGGANPSVVTMDSNKSVTAVFKQAASLVVQPSANQLVGYGATTLTFQVSNGGVDAMAWNAFISDGEEFLRINSGASGTDTGTVVIGIDEHVGDTERSGNLTISVPSTGDSHTITITQQAPAPVLSLLPALQNVGPAGGDVSFSVSNTGTGSFQWTAYLVAGQEYAQISSGTSGTTDGVVVVNVQANPDLAERSVTLRVEAAGAGNSPAEATIVQGSNAPELRVLPEARVIGSAGGTVDFTVDNAGNGFMTWVASVVSGSGFLSITAGATGTDDGQVSVQVSVNLTGEERTGTVQIEAPNAVGSPTELTITQTAEETVLHVAPAEQAISGLGGALQFAVTNQGTGQMNWSATVRSGVGFVSIDAGTAAGAAPGAVSVTVKPNNTGEERVATLEISAPGAALSPQVVTVRQTPDESVLQVSPESQLVASTGGNVSFVIENLGDGVLSWNASIIQGANWLYLVAPASGNADGTLTVTVSPNTGEFERSGTIRVDAPGAVGSPREVTITQLPANPVLHVAPLERVVSSAGVDASQPLSFQVQNRGEGPLSWTVAVLDGERFINLLTTSGTDDSVIQVTVDPNLSDQERTATLQVQAAGAANSPQTIIIRQTTSNAVLRVMPLEQNIGSLGGNLTFEVSNVGEGTLVWMVTISDGTEFLSLVSASTGFDSGTVSITVAPYAGARDRTGHLLFSAPDAAESPQEATITQTARDPVLRVLPETQTIGSNGGTAVYSIDNAGAGTLAWTASILSGASFVTISPPTQGSATGTLNVVSQPNDFEVSRTAEIRIEAAGNAGSPQQVVIVELVQDACGPPARPTDLSASDGTYSDAVQLLWSEVPGVTHYEIFRGLTDDIDEADFLGISPSPLFVDDTAPYPDVSIVGRSCISAGQYDVEYYVFYYWVRSSNDCSESIFSSSDEGYRGRIKRPTYSLTKLRALPAKALSPGVREGAPDASLWLRLLSDSPIDAATVWGTVRATNFETDDLRWLPADEAEARDGWVLYEAEEDWIPGESVVMTAGALDIHGAPVGPETFEFRIASDSVKGLHSVAIEQPAYAAIDTSGIDLDAEAAAVDVHELLLGAKDAALESAASPHYEILPEEAYAVPQRVWLPVPQGELAEDLALYYYLDDGEEANWYPAENVQGWLVPGSHLALDIGGQPYLGILVNHAGTVCLGRPAPLDDGFDGASVIPGPTAKPAHRGDNALLALAVLLLLGATATTRKLLGRA